MNSKPQNQFFLLKISEIILKYILFLSGFITHFYFLVCVKYWWHFLGKQTFMQIPFSLKILPFKLLSFLTFFGCQYKPRLIEMEGLY